MSGLESAIYVGHVRHRRSKPAHQFTVPLFMMYLDLEELGAVFQRRWLWSARRPAPARFRRSDHLGDPDQPLESEVRRLVRQAVGEAPEGPVRLLTHLRYFGYGFNPVSFYFLFDRRGERVEAMVAEVDNTPWGERYCYVLPGGIGGDETGRYRFEKDFHVSPFLPMDLTYDWRVSLPGRRLSVHMDALRAGDRVFDATLVLDRREVSGRTLAFTLARFPLMTTRVIVGIYYEAARLWLKRAPFYPHPRGGRQTDRAVDRKPTR